MLRSMVRWVLVLSGDWRSVMVTMNQKLAAAERLYPWKSWTEKHMRNQFRLAVRIPRRGDKWPALVCRWMPRQNWL